MPEDTVERLFRKCRVCGTLPNPDEKECPLCRLVRCNEAYLYEWVLKVVETRAGEIAGSIAHDHEYKNKHEMDFHHRGYKNWNI